MVEQLIRNQQVVGSSPILGSTLVPPSPNRQIPRPGRAATAFGRLWLRVFGWRVEGDVPDVSRAVFVAAPHTSNWDLAHMLAASWVFRIRLSWVGKHTLFTVPLWGRFLRTLGGVPVDRRARHGFVGEAAARIRDAEEGCLLAIPPSGTRSRAPHWKSGFYHIAVSAGVPIVLGSLDYAKRRAVLGPVIAPSGDIAADMDRIRAFYLDKRGRHPAQETPVRLKDEGGAD